MYSGELNEWFLLWLMLGLGMSPLLKEIVALRESSYCLVVQKV